MTDILIVEDNKELADLLCDFLRAENYTVSVAETGEKALSLYEKYGAKPNVVRQFSAAQCFYQNFPEVIDSVRLLC